jgi:hypothetical protein
VSRAAVAFKLAKVTGKDELLESLHSVLYRRKGVVGPPAYAPAARA